MSAQHMTPSVLPVLVKLASLGGVVMAQYNTPKATSTIRSHLRQFTTAQVRSALRKAEKAGDVECCANPGNCWNPNAADMTEHHWRLSAAALAKAAAP